MEQTIWDEAFEKADQSFVDIDINESLGDKAPSTHLIREETKVMEEFLPPSMDVMGLLELGALTEEIDVRGYKIRIRTLTIGEELEIGLLVKEYIGTQEEARSYMTAMVAASVVSVNNQPLVQTLGLEESLMAKKFDYVSKNWYWPVINQVYKEIVDLQLKAENALKEIKKN